MTTLEATRLDAGHAVAVPAAVGAGLVATAARVTVAADPFSDLAFDLDVVAREADELRAELLALGADDATAFDRARDLSLRVADLAADVLERGDPHLRADARVAVLFATASADAAAVVVEALREP